MMSRLRSGQDSKGNVQCRCKGVCVCGGVVYGGSGWGTCEGVCVDVMVVCL